MTDTNNAPGSPGALPLPDDQIPGDERMSPAEFRVVREFLGLTTRWVADQLRVAERTVHRWESGVSPIPDGVRMQIEQWEQITAQVVTEGIENLLDLPDPALGTYRSDEDYRAAEPGEPWPASWHRAVVARIAQEAPALIIAYH